jgi:FkbM family methyltransferase
LKLLNTSCPEARLKQFLNLAHDMEKDTELFAKRYPFARVFAFECNPNTVKFCKDKLAAYSNVVLTEKAVSKTDGKVSFFNIDKATTVTTWEDGNQGASSLLLASGKYPVEHYAQQEIVVDSVSLKSFLEQNDIKGVDLMWIDIQGAELLALEGLGEKINHVGIFHIEVEFFEIYTDQPLFSQVRSFFKAHGFQLLGFTALSRYSGDAVFVNPRLINKYALKQARKDLIQLDDNFSFKKVIKKIKRRISKIIGSSK